MSHKPDSLPSSDCVCSFFDDYSEPVYITNPETFEILYSNRSFAAQFGSSDHLLCYQTIYDRTIPCDSCSIEHSGNPRSLAFSRDSHSSRTDRWYRCRAKATIWNQSPARCCVLEDISEFKRTEDALRASESRYRALAESAKDMIFIVDTAGRLRYANTSCCEIVHRSKEDIIGKHLSEIFDKRVSERQVASVQKVIREHHPYSVEAEINSPQGHGIWLSTLLVPLRLEDSSIGAMGISRDITTRKSIENRQKESEEKFRTLAEQSPNMIYIYDGERAVYVNDRCEQLLGYSRDELLAPRFDFRELISPDSLPNVLYNMEQQYKGVETAPLEHGVIKKDGSRLDVISTLRLIQFEGTRALLGTVIDITDQKRTRREKELIQAQLVEAQKMEAIGTLTGGIAHDFNNMLTGIRGFSQLALLELGKNDPVYEDIQQIEEITRRAGSLTRQLLLFSRRQPIELTVFNPNETVRSIVPMLQRLIGEQFTIDCNLRNDLWLLQADQNKIEQIIVNLAVNARDAMPGGGTIRIQTNNFSNISDVNHPSPEFQTGEFVCVKISDEGVGIEQETMGRIFEPFFTTKETNTGTGLGLAVVYGIVKQHQGWVHVDSTPGKGAVFSVYLPAYSGEKAAVPAQENPKSSFGRHSGAVLVLEDEKVVRDFACRALEKAQFEVIVADTVADAQLRIQERENDLFAFFGDVILPDGNGIDLADHLASRNPSIRILLTSGYIADQIHTERIRESGYRFLQKPYDIAQLNAALRSLLEESRTAG